MYRLALVITIFILPELVFSQSIHINITGIRSDRGVIILSLYENQEQFKSEQPVYEQKFTKAGMKDSTLFLCIDNLKPGVYAMGVLDDENENGEMDYRRFKLPIEGFGFSNYYLKGFFRPDFDDFSFNLKDNNTYVFVRMKYIKKAE